jgi:metallo-beta-lactamase family protein
MANGADASFQFLGAAGGVTGSKYLFSCGADQFLIDCGLFQGLKELRQRNWAPVPIDLERLRAVILTHAHIDHSGYLPRLVSRGYKGPVFATPATCDLLGVMLPDAAHLQEEEARYANRKGYSRHTPALPLYRVEDAELCLTLLRPLERQSRRTGAENMTDPAELEEHAFGDLDRFADARRTGITGISPSSSILRIM